MQSHNPSESIFIVEVVSKGTTTEAISDVNGHTMVSNMLKYVTCRKEMKREILFDISNKSSKAFIFKLLKYLLQTLHWMQIVHEYLWIPINTRCSSLIDTIYYSLFFHLNHSLPQVMYNDLLIDLNWHDCNDKWEKTNGKVNIILSIFSKCYIFCLFSETFQIIANIVLFLIFLSETLIEVAGELYLKAIHISSFPC